MGGLSVAYFLVFEMSGLLLVGCGDLGCQLLLSVKLFMFRMYGLTSRLPVSRFTAPVLT